MTQETIKQILQKRKPRATKGVYTNEVTIVLDFQSYSSIKHQMMELIWDIRSYSL